ncbi:hypothetical protein AA12717_0813 [Gluconacetobacter sacchari DSM 12717]|uniref:Uncharacterized protein n=1 Tax=Gluconacetobacter sacchari DSM 12717 TaxID=1307940 RepID=A0ABQ0P3T4_9PROT|nr:hypothetical protein [Gluconacetobacter sacchari]GBQ21227.1 hypothetical protein AA12717_0813 [Gluconacetobacter sacchari DSM 12717]
MRALRSFAGAFKVRVGDFEVSVDSEPGVADSGNLEHDLTELFLEVGEAARAAGRGWALLIDEDLRAKIVTLTKECPYFLQE